MVSLALPCDLKGLSGPQFGPRCMICWWRTQVLPEADGTVTEENHTPMHRMQAGPRLGIMHAMHERPSDLWVKVLRTLKVFAGVRFPSQGQKAETLMKFECRNMRPIQRLPSAHLQTEQTSLKDYDSNVQVPAADGTFTVYHMTPLRSLVEGTAGGVGNGIFNDAGMSYGVSHGDGIGVYMHARQPFELFTVHDGWVMLELKVHPYRTAVKHGSKGRYLIKSDQSLSSIGQPCYDVEVMSLWSIYAALPEFLKC